MAQAGFELPVQLRMTLSCPGFCHAGVEPRAPHARRALCPLGAVHISQLSFSHILLIWWFPQPQVSWLPAVITERPRGGEGGAPGTETRCGKALQTQCLETAFPILTHFVDL